MVASLLSSAFPTLDSSHECHMTLPAATLDTPTQRPQTHLQVLQPDLLPIPEDPDSDPSSSESSTPVSSPHTTTDDEVFFNLPLPAMAQQPAVTGSQMVSVPIFEGDKGTGVISWCESLDRSQVQFQWTMAQTCLLYTSPSPRD